MGTALRLRLDYSANIFLIGPIRARFTRFMSG